MTWHKMNCPFCGKRFMRIRSLIQHYYLRHSINRLNDETFLNSLKSSSF